MAVVVKSPSKIGGIKSKPYFKNEDEGFDDLVAPARTTVAEAFESIKGFLPEYKPVDYKPVDYTPVTAREVGGITGTLDDDYFNSIEEQSKRKLNEQFFGAEDSLQKRLQNQMNRRGLIGSGIEVGGTNQLYKTFGDELVDLQSNVLQKRLESQKELAFKNKDIDLANALAVNEFTRENARLGNETAKENARQQLLAEQKNREFEGFLSELGLKAASDEARTSTDYATKMFGEQVNLAKSDREFQTQLMDQLLRALGEEKIDPETRQIFEDLFGSRIGAALGGPNDSDYVSTQRKKKEDELSILPDLGVPVDPWRPQTAGRDGRIYRWEPSEQRWKFLRES